MLAHSHHDQKKSTWVEVGEGVIPSFGSEIEYDETPTLTLTHCSRQIYQCTTNNIPTYAYSYVEPE